MVKTYKLEQRTPTLQEYTRLCDSVGWTDFMNYDVAETSLENSLFSVVIMDHEQAIGMGRIGESPLTPYLVIGCSLSCAGAFMALKEKQMKEERNMKQ